MWDHVKKVRRRAERQSSNELSDGQSRTETAVAEGADTDIVTALEQLRGEAAEGDEDQQFSFHEQKVIRAPVAGLLRDIINKRDKNGELSDERYSLMRRLYEQVSEMQKSLFIEYTILRAIEALRSTMR